MTGAARIGPEWADLVFHVLAHVPAPRPLASSLWNARYVAFCERHLGPVSARSLAEDVAVLSQLLTSHELTARLQWAALLFPDVPVARTFAARELGEFGAGGAANPHAVRALASEPALENAAEVLRAAAEIEAPAHARLPLANVPVVRIEALLAEAAGVAPYLNRLPVLHLRALTRHGRALDGAIYVGVPADELDVDTEWAAMQAAHEATVVEVAGIARRAGVPLGERDVEHAALIVLGERVQPAPLRDAHARWWTGTQLPALHQLRAALGEDARRVVSAALENQSEGGGAAG